MKTRLPKLIVGLLITFLVGFTCYHAGRSSVYRSQYNYFKQTEILLDSIAKWDNSFMDTVMETDTYYIYEVERNNLYRK